MNTRYSTFEDWFAEQEGFSVRAERFDGDVAWLKAAFEAGRSKPGGEAEALLNLIREEASKDNAPFGRSDSMALRRIRSLLGLDPRSGRVLTEGILK